MDIRQIKSNYKDINWLKSNHTKIHYFGLGFIQLKLTPEFRLHFYTEKLAPIVADEDIHDHRYPFVSHILKGIFNQYLYEMVDGNNYILEYDSCQEGCSPEIIRECDFRLFNVSSYVEGSSYSINDDVFHRVWAINTITLLQRPSSYTKEKARVGHIKGHSKVCPFSKKVSEGELWEIVKEMIV